MTVMSSKKRLTAYRKRLSSLIDYFYLIPFATLTIPFLFFPFSQAFYYIFLEWDGFGEKKFIGVQNFIRMVEDRRFIEALTANLIYVLFFWALPIILGLLLTVFLGRRTFTGQGILRVAMLTPLAMTSVAIGIVFYTIFSPSGLINEILRLLNVPMKIAWLGSTLTARLAIGLVGTWAMVGFAFILFLSAFQRIPTSYLEVADLEGATNLQKLRYVILPYLKPTIIFVSLFSLIGALGTTAYGIVSSLTGGAYYTRPLAHYGYAVAFVEYEVGYGASIIFIPAIVGLILSYIIYRVE